MKQRGLHESAKRLEEEIRSGRAGSDPVVIVNDPAGSDGEGGNGGEGGGEGSKPLAKRRASARLAKQSHKETITVQELAARSAPKTPAVPPIATTSTQGQKKGGRGKSPVSRSPVTSTNPAFRAGGPSASSSKSNAGPSVQTRQSPTPAATPVTATPDPTQLQAILQPVIAATAAQTAEENKKLTDNLMATLTRAGITVDEAMARDPTDQQRGYKDLENWVDGALDMYRVSFFCVLTFNAPF